MIIVLVYKPSESGQLLAHAEYPFADVDVFGLYLDEDEEAVLAMLKGLITDNPAWRFATVKWTKPVIVKNLPDAKFRWRRT